jgi:parallel beta-helix repeat protein
VVIESVIDDNATGLGGRGGSGTGTDGDGGNRGQGGGIYNAEIATLSDTTIKDNVARNGGGLRSYSGTTTLDGCTVSGNTAAGSGGGLYSNNSSTTMLTNSTFSSNGAHGSGGGICIEGTARLTHVTVADNTADVDNDGIGGGGGLYGFTGSTTMTNTIIAKNYDKGGENPDCIASITSGDYNLLGIGDSVGCTFTSQPHDQVGTAASPLNPALRVLANYGGSTETHALHPSSPAVDQIPVGVNGCAMGSRDQRGVLRWPPCSIGAFESDQTESVYLPLVVKD